MKLIRLSFIALLFASVFSSCKKHNEDPFIVDAGPAQSVQLPANTATVAGAAVSGGTASMTYLWTVLSGPGAPGFITGNAASTVVNNLVEGKYIFQLQVTNSNGITAVDTTSVTVKAPVLKTLTLQPGADDGIDSWVNIMYSCTPGVPDEHAADIQNGGMNAEINVTSWTYNSQGCASGTSRGLIKFSGIDNIPSNSNIISARLSLYSLGGVTALTWGNSYYPGSPYNPFGTNEVLIKRITSAWNETAVTWNTQPSSTASNQVIIPASTSKFDYNVIDMDVTNMVKDIKTSGNYGFLLQFQVEQYYRSMFFASSDNADPAKHPKLVITYY